VPIPRSFVLGGGQEPRNIRARRNLADRSGMAGNRRLDQSLFHLARPCVPGHSSVAAIIGTQHESFVMTERGFQSILSVAPSLIRNKDLPWRPETLMYKASVASHRQPIARSHSLIILSLPQERRYLKLRDILTQSTCTHYQHTSVAG
jgi:hypothetical protein